MTKLLEVVQKLTDAERREVEDFAEFLLTRRSAALTDGKSDRPNKINFEGWAGCLAHVNPELSDAQFNQLMLDEWARAAED